MFLHIKMKPIDITKQFRKIKWTTEHTLTSDQLKMLIQHKLERAEKQHLALKKQEMLVQKHR